MPRLELTSEKVKSAVTDGKLPFMPGSIFLAKIAYVPAVTFKQALTDVAVEKMGPIGSEMQRLVGDSGHIDKVLARGAEQARDFTAADIVQGYPKFRGYKRIGNSRYVEVSWQGLPSPAIIRLQGKEQ